MLKALVVALVLWVPAATFADAAMSHVHADEATCERVADAEIGDVLPSTPVTLVKTPVAHAIDSDDVCFRGAHRREPLLPPPNASALA